MPWTEFTDMYSKGFRKTDWDKIYIEATKNDAISVFLDIFGIDPDFVTCSCCGPNYSVNEYETLEQATAYDRNCKFNEYGDRWLEEPKAGEVYIPLDELPEAKPEFRFINAEQIRGI